MLARLQRTLVAVLLLAAIGWTFYAWDRSPLCLWSGLFVIFFGHSLFLALEFILVYRINLPDPAPHSGPYNLIRAWLGETLRAPRVFCWQQPFRASSVPDQLDCGQGKRGVVFIHGFVCNRGFWNPWFGRLRGDQRAFAAVSLEPVFGSIDEYVPIIDAAVTKVTRATGMPPLVVCHSMGGLAVRAWMRTMVADDRVYRIVTLGTPHHGTWAARFSHAYNGRQMRLGSPWIKRLARDEPIERRKLFVCYYSNCDNIVFPTSTACLEGAENRFIEGTAHITMAFETRIMDEVLALL